MQFTESDLKNAVDSGIFAEADADRFRKVMAIKLNGGAINEQEPFRLVTGFTDFFAAMACLLILFSLYDLFRSDENWISLIGFAVVLLAGLGLAEQFIRRHRFALTGIVLVVALFTGFTGIVFTPGSMYGGFGWMGFSLLSPGDEWQLLLIGVGSALFGWALWRRYRVPVTATVASLSVIMCVLGYANLFDGNERWLMLLFGLLVFTAAMYLDKKDMVRSSVISDVAFWMHLLAAQLITYPVFVWLDLLELQVLHELLLIILFFLSMLLISLLTDRKVFIVSCLSTVEMGFYMYLTTAMTLTLNHASVAALLMGLVLLLLLTFWDGCRRIALGLCPDLVRQNLRPLSLG